jgi:hypothetical protein
MSPHGIDAVHSGLLDIPPCLNDEIAHQVIDHPADGFVELPARRSVGILLEHWCMAALEDPHFPQILDGQQAGTHAVVNVVIVIGNGIGQVRKLRLEPGLRAIQEALADVAEQACVLHRAVLQRPRGIQTSD